MLNFRPSMPPLPAAAGEAATSVSARVVKATASRILRVIRASCISRERATLKA
jgi:hypothetical protein